jgi:putative FmdB family regulatory protein
MPVYMYTCKKCGYEQEFIHPMNGPNYPIICKKCGHKKLKKNPITTFIVKDKK